MASRIPEIPHDKSYHLFVCYEKKSIDIVKRIVDNLEKNGIVCYYYARDSLPGQSFLKSIYDGIKKSSYMLIVLSEDFENSDYCQHEVEEAIDLKIRGEYSLIPIKTEPCSVPERLQHLMYIDVEDDVDGAHNKIIDAIVNKDIREESKKDRNGKYLRFKIESYRPNKLSLRRYKLEFTDRQKSQIWSNNFEVSSELLQDIEDTVNSSLFVQYLHVWRYSYLYILMIFLLLLILIAISVLIVFITTSGKEKADSFQPTGYLLAIGLPLWFISLIVSEMLCVHNVDSSNRLFSITRKVLEAELWHKSKENNAQTGVIFLLGSIFYTDMREFYIYIMRYNFKKCKAYFARHIEEKETLKKLRKENETNEECASRLFDEFFSREVGRAARLLEPRVSGRHKMQNNAKCICLLVEESLKPET